MVAQHISLRNSLFHRVVGVQDQPQIGSGEAGGAWWKGRAVERAGMLLRLIACRRCCFDMRGKEIDGGAGAPLVREVASERSRLGRARNRA